MEGAQAWANLQVLKMEKPVRVITIKIFEDGELEYQSKDNRPKHLGLKVQKGVWPAWKCLDMVAYAFGFETEYGEKNV